MTDDEARELTARIAALERQLEIKDGIIAELLKRLYGVKSEKIDSAQLLLELLGDEPKKPDAAGLHDGPAAEPALFAGEKKLRKPRRQKLRDSLKHLPRSPARSSPRRLPPPPRNTGASARRPASGSRSVPPPLPGTSPCAPPS